MQKEITSNWLFSAKTDLVLQPWLQYESQSASPSELQGHSLINLTVNRRSLFVSGLKTIYQTETSPIFHISGMHLYGLGLCEQLGIPPIAQEYFDGPHRCS